MLAIERRKEILTRLEAEGKVLVSELAKDFAVTEETIRRDLEKLDNEGLASKTYGGAVSKHTATLDLPYKIRIGVNVEEKQRIADSVAQMISDGERIMLDSSSTAIYIIKKLKEKKNLTVITNSVVILLELADKSDWTVLSTGGNLKEGALSLTGSSAEKMIRSYHVDTAICSCKGVDMEIGITDSNEKDCLIKQAMFASAERKILAADTLKLNKKSFVRVCEFSDIDYLVTDQKPNDEWREFCKKSNVKNVFG